MPIRARAKRFRKPRPTEADVTSAVVEAFAMVGVPVERQNTGAASYPNADGTARHVRFGRPGDLDWRGTIPGDGRRLEVEIKRPGGRPTPEQLARIREINRDGGVAFWVNDAEQVLRVMPLVLRGAWVVEGEPGSFYVTDEGANGARHG